MRWSARLPRLATTSLRTRLVLLVLLAMLPLAVFLLADLVVDQGSDLEAARSRAVELAQLGAEQQDSLLQEARTVLAVLSRVPQVAASEPGSCHALMRQLVDDHPRMASLLVTDDAGRITCSSLTADPKLNIGDRRYAQQLLRPGAQGYELSDLVISLATNRPALFVGLALPPRPGTEKPSGITAAGLNLDWLAGMTAKLARDGSGRDGSGTASVLDTRDGAVLARSSGNAAAPSPAAPDHPALKAYRIAPGQAGTADGIGPDGVERIYGYAPLPGTDGRAILAVGFARQQVLAYATYRILRTLALTLAAVLAAVACTLLAAWRMLVHPAEAIMQMASRLSAGDLAARGALPDQTAPELRLLADTLNSMAASVATTQGKLADSEGRFRQLAGTDGLTGLANRRLFDEVYEREGRRMARAGAPLSILLLDVDCFKAYNDRYGHLAGDDCLRTVAAVVNDAVCRPGDLVARFGGEEFVVLLPGTEITGAADVAERIRSMIADLGLEHAGNVASHGVVTVSIGFAAVTPGPAPDMEAKAGSGPASLAADMAGVLAEADRALYVAKCAGRNLGSAAGPAAPRSAQRAGMGANAGGTPASTAQHPHLGTPVGDD